MYRNFNEIIDHVKKSNKKISFVVVCAHEEGLLDAMVKVVNDNIATPILIGDREFIINYLGEKNFSIDKISIIDEKDSIKAANIAVDYIKAGKAQCIMKGEIKTSDLMKIILNSENCLRTGKIVSSFSIRELPNYHKLMGFADTGVCISPTLEQKIEILDNSVEVLHRLGVECPKVAVVCAVEYVNPKMAETVEAAEIKERNVSGKITDCLVEGPISYDLAVSKKSAQIKEFSSPVAGDADLLIFPNLVSGNLTTKALEYHADVKGAAIITGAKIPIIFGSRAATTDFRYRSVALASIYVENQ